MHYFLSVPSSYQKENFHFWCFYIDNPLNKAASRESRLYILDWHQCQDGNEDKLKTFPPHLDSSFVLFKFLTDCFDVLYVMPHSVFVCTIKNGKNGATAQRFLLNILHYRFFPHSLGALCGKKTQEFEANIIIIYHGNFQIDSFAYFRTLCCYTKMNSLPLIFSAIFSSSFLFDLIMYLPSF